MKKLHVTDLIIEITRRCNKKCKICLRGPQQNIDISLGILYSIASRLESVSTLTFTGGEPSLAPECMYMARDAFRHYNVSVNDVWLATNGKLVSDDFLAACREWHMYAMQTATPCDAKVSPKTARSIIQNIDEAGLYVALSMDEYHGSIDKNNLLRLSTLPHLLADKYQDSASHDWVINTGRAVTTGTGVTDPKSTFPWEYDGSQMTLDIQSDGDDLYVDSLYICANGDILKYCNYSYKDMKKYAIASIRDTGTEKHPDTGWLDRLVSAATTPNR